MRGQGRRVWAGNWICRDQRTESFSLSVRAARLVCFPLCFLRSRQQLTALFHFFRDLYPDIVASDFAWECSRNERLAAAAPVFKPHAPAMPAADHGSVLDQTFGEWKAQMGAEVLERKETLIPPEYCDVQSIDLEPESGSILGNIARRERLYPLVRLVHRGSLAEGRHGCLVPEGPFLLRVILADSERSSIPIRS